MTITSIDVSGPVMTVHGQTFYAHGNSRQRPESLELYALGPYGTKFPGEFTFTSTESWASDITVTTSGYFTIKAWADQRCGGELLEDFDVQSTDEEVIVEPPHPQAWEDFTFIRLEPHCRSQDYARGLEARTADPLWFLARQWQTGEFQGENAGSPIRVEIDHSTQAPETIQLGANAPIPLPKAPLEMVVEQEWTGLDWRRRVQVGQQFERLIRRVIQQSAPEVIQDYRKANASSLAPTESERARMDPATFRFIAVMEGRVIDGGKIMENPPRLDGFADGQWNELTEKFRAWCAAMNLRPESSKPPAWRDESLDYRFDLDPPLYYLFNASRLDPPLFRPNDGSGVSARTSALESFPLGAIGWIFGRLWQSLLALLNLVRAGHTPLGAPSYDGNLEWYSFNAGGHQGPWKKHIGLTACPTRISVGGASAGWWEMEDAAIALGQIEVAKPNLLTLALMEFMFLYGDDWFSVPLALPVSHLVKIDQLRVVDVFGQTLTLKPAARLDHDPMRRFQLFALSPLSTARPAGDDPGVPNLLFIPPVSGLPQESPPLEEVLFLRDEGANMVWAVERTVRNGLGEPVDGAGAHRERAERDRLAARARLAVELQEPASSAPRYRLASEVPAPWIPFIPAVPESPDAAGIRLCRARMLLNLDQQEAVEIPALTRLLEYEPREGEANPEGLRHLQEATVPRSGLRYQLTAQRALGPGGETYLWIGRKVLAGRGEGSSGLRFDVLQDSASE